MRPEIQSPHPAWYGQTGTYATGHLVRLTLEVGSYWGVTDKYSVGATGGEETHALTEAEGPSHTHKFSAGGQALLIYADSDILNNPALGFQMRAGQSWDNKNKNSSGIASTGQGKAHNNMPPYYVLTYIMRL